MKAFAQTDCYRPAGCRCTGAAGLARLAPRAKRVRDAVVAWGVAERGWTADGAYFAAPGHEQHNGFAVSYEGDYEWPFSLPTAVREIAHQNGVLIEVGAGWRLDLYAESDY